MFVEMDYKYDISNYIYSFIESLINFTIRKYECPYSEFYLDTFFKN